MYRKGEVYDEIKNVIIDIYIDFDIHQFPVDEKWLCRRMGVALIPYSAYDTDARSFMRGGDSPEEKAYPAGNALEDYIRGRR